MNQLKIKDAALRPWRREVESQVLVLPYPVSVNAMFNDGDIGRGKRPITPEYKAWKFQAEMEIMRQRSGRVPGPVKISLFFEQRKGRHDLDNLIKGPLDTMCKMGVIDGDHSSVVREISAAWALGITGCHIVITKSQV